MKKDFLFFIIIGIYAMNLNAQPWQPAGNKIKTQWAEEVNPANPLPEYPRPQMERAQWLNLNGLWGYAILERGGNIPATLEGKILVPFAIESSLSGVQKRVGENKELWYERTFTVPSEWKNKDVVLNFGAVDWKADVWVNNIKVGTHKGGYTPFSFNITPFLSKSSEQKLMVKVWDPTDKGFQPRGKQVEDPRSIWYTPVTGIWQTVWIEPVEKAYITHLKTVTNIDGENITVKAATEGTSLTDIIEVKVLENGNVVSTGKAAAGQEVLVSVPDAKLWSPESPFLYDMKVTVLRDGKPVDKVKSYFGMRKISTARDKNGIVRMQLNNKDYFHFGPLDQGWWPDGLYTAPTDEALLYDIKKTKDFGFNMIRKHVKVEPARWYYHCDREGILVWQDMPNGDAHPEWQRRNYFDGKELERSAESEENFRREWKEVMDLTYSNPSVVVWVPFNERWGQFKTEEIVEWTKNYDPSRLINPASGGNHYDVGDMIDMHNYPDPVMGLFDSKRVNVLGEYGGIGLVLEHHFWEKDRNWGYVQCKNSEEATKVYIEYAEKLKKLIPFGYSGAVYTQTTDVEIEVNGLLTYDRKVIKLNEEKIRKINQEVCNSLND
ncbi:Glycosyl hydrolases family 2, TIM barrel domain [Tangfeifania diversioriginum]|uniref:Glycosyl hydrolases family 2, TIM barrel domain n=1 Tax=Tangfeifania diversioriginum TaxID=1168035 RepID=A0A1M6MC68_9BACT|nr:sugar-binding domain-containing protein [Tangfeifania diversioriginum]SHJ81019.1 Glycosyl hydrolases family 2, TIM barrel domain [Tangfeifania diversioriginum]